MASEIGYAHARDWSKRLRSKQIKTGNGRHSKSCKINIDESLSIIVLEERISYGDY